MFSTTSRFLAIATFLVSGVLALPTLPTLEANGTSALLEQRAQAVYTTCRIPGKVVALTFDDGPYVYETTLVNYLNSQGVKATFFLNGNNYDCIYGQAASVKHLYSSGHEIGSHTWDHPELTSLSNAQITSELTRINQAIVYILGVKPRYFRPPYGDINGNIANLVAAQGQIPVTWNFDSGDSVGATTAQSITSYQNWIKTGKSLIALNHETEPGTVNTVVKTVVPLLKAAGYRFVTISQCLNLGSSYVTPAGPKGPGHC
ncbi:Carbohydrate esterase 4 protein [Tulasnella sp. JGI-2019a]|nr:Carbohydrate esterase 4 protein [Tulasnella sp. JGI-2019a]